MKNMINNLVHLVLVMGIFACNKKQPEFIFCSSLSSKYQHFDTFRQDSVYYATEIYLLKNPPKNKNKMYEISNAFNDSINQFYIYNRNNMVLQRGYYKENKKIPLIVKDDSSGFTKEMIIKHEKDFILFIELEYHDTLIDDRYTFRSIPKCNTYRTSGYEYYPQYDKREEI